jgi:hypothetical protein
MTLREFIQQKYYPESIWVDNRDFNSVQEILDYLVNTQCPMAYEELQYVKYFRPTKKGKDCLVKNPTSKLHKQCWDREYINPNQSSINKLKEDIIKHSKLSECDKKCKSCDFNNHIEKYDTTICQVLYEVGKFLETK